MVRCRKQHKGKEKVVRARGKRMHRARTAWCTARTALTSPSRPWWLALLACGGAYWPLALEPFAMTSRHPYYCGHPHCRGHPPAWVGIQNMFRGGGGGQHICNAEDSLPTNGKHPRNPNSTLPQPQWHPPTT